MTVTLARFQQTEDLLGIITGAALGVMTAILGLTEPDAGDWLWIPAVVAVGLPVFFAVRARRWCHRLTRILEAAPSPRPGASLLSVEYRGTVIRIPSRHHQHLGGTPFLYLTRVTGGPVRTWRIPLIHGQPLPPHPATVGTAIVLGPPGHRYRRQPVVAVIGGIVLLPRGSGRPARRPRPSTSRAQTTR